MEEKKLEKKNLLDIFVAISGEWAISRCFLKVKVKITLVQALRLCTGRTAHTGSRGIALLFHDQRH